MARQLGPTGRWIPEWTREWALDSGVLLFSQLAATAATSALAILIARNLNPHEWGVFSGFLALGLALAVFGEFGTSTWLLRELTVLLPNDGEPDSETRSRVDGLVANSLLLSLSISGTFVLATAAAVYFLRLQLGLAFAVIALVAYGGLISASTVPEAFFRSRRNLRRIVGATLVEKGLLLALVAAVVVTGGGVVPIALVYVISGVARLGFDVVNTVVRDGLRLSTSGARGVTTIFRRSLPFGANRAFLNVIPRADAFLLAIISPVAAGHFALGDRVVGPALIIPVVASRALYPFLARENATSGLKVVMLFAGAGVAAAAIGVFVAPFVVPLLFGSAYRSAVHVIQLMILVVPFVFVSNPLLVHLYTARREDRRLTIVLALVAVLGTAVILSGQLLIGTTVAAGGYVLRQALFVAVLAIAALARARPMGGRGRGSDQSGYKTPVVTATGPPLAAAEALPPLEHGATGGDR